PDGLDRTIGESIWTDAGPEPLRPPVQLAYQQRPSPLEPEIPLFRGGGGALPPMSSPAPVPASPGLLALAAEAAERLVPWLSRRNSRSRTAVLGFTAREYVNQGTAEAPTRLWVGYLTEDDVKNACREYGKAQTWTNDAAAKVRRSAYETASAYGTA